MDVAPVVYDESGIAPRSEDVPLSHLSIEVGHFFMEDLANGGRERVLAQFRKIKPLVDGFVAAAKIEHGPAARVSTCFLVDDYFRRDSDPADVLEKVLGAAEEAELTIDYMAREAACWEAPIVSEELLTGTRIALAEQVAACIVAEPPPDFSGRRPSTQDAGWLCNGLRGTEEIVGGRAVPTGGPAQAMREVEQYRPPEEFGRRNHSIFLDVQLWSEITRTVGGRDETLTLWSCPFLATVWQLLRLGVLRDHGRSVLDPVSWELPVERGSTWWDMPGLIRLNPKAKPFAAYRAMSILPQRYLGIEHSVRVILDHLKLDDEVIGRLVARGAQEKPPLELPRQTGRRLSHMFLDES
jgi:hypothetical protein